METCTLDCLKSAVEVSEELFRTCTARGISFSRQMSENTLEGTQFISMLRRHPYELIWKLQIHPYGLDPGIVIWLVLREYAQRNANIFTLGRKFPQPDDAWMCRLGGVDAELVPLHPLIRAQIYDSEDLERERLFPHASLLDLVERIAPLFAQSTS